MTEPDRVERVIQAWRRELPEILGPTSELAKRITLLAGALERTTRAETGALGLTAAEYDVLAALRRSGPPYRLRPSGLSGELLLSSGGTTKVLSQLSARGLVSRHPDGEDGRVSWVGLTAAGAELAERVIRATSAAQQHVLGGASRDDIAIATGALKRITATMPDGKARKDRSPSSPRKTTST
jgi:DNA-binding MarR family transcriptional regulator